LSVKTEDSGIPQTEVCATPYDLCHFL